MSAFLMKLLNMSLTATVVLAVILLLRAMLKNHVPRRGLLWLWIAAALALVWPLRPVSPLSIWNSADLLSGTAFVSSEVQTTVKEVDSMYTEETPSVLSAPVGTGEPLKIPLDGSTDYIHDIPWQEPAQENMYHDIPAVEYPLAAQPHTASRIEWLSIFFVLWSTGVAVMAIYAVIRYAQIKRRVAVSVPFVDGAYLCDDIDTPFVLGFFQPKIYLPSSLADGDFVPVIAHERAHIAHGDHIYKAIGWWILTAHWFNPLVWVCYHCFCSDLEFACDERAVKNLGMDERRSYAEALLSCSIGAKRSLALSHPLAFGEIGVKERISSVLTYREPGVLRSCVPLLILPILVGVFLTDAPKDIRDDLFEQRNYGIVKMEKQQSYTVSIPTAALTDDIYSEGGREYAPNEFILYQYAPTTMYLSKIAPVIGEDDLMWIFVTFDYTDYGKQGVVTTVNEPQYRGTALSGWRSRGHIICRDIEDVNTTYSDAVQSGSQAQGIELGFYIDREVLENAEGFISFTISGLTDSWYRRGDAVDESKMIVTKGGVVGPDCVEMYVNNYDNQPIDLTLALEAFPDASLASDAMNIYMVEDDKKHWILSGMPVRNVYLSDLTGDGKPEFCASVYWGSGMIDSHIVVYDYVEKQEYTLWDRGVFDYRLEMENNTLYAVMTDYNTRAELYRDVLMLIPTGDDYALSMGEPNSEGVLSDLFKHAEVYVSERCIYMTPLSSTLSIGGDTGYRYLIDPDKHSFCQIHRDTGSIQMVGSLLGGWKEFPWTDEEWAELFVFGAIKDTAISEVYSHRKAMSLGADQYLLSMDDELWLMKVGNHPDGSEYVWSIHELVPESQKGFAYYRYMPAVSALPPYLNITFDLPEDMNISAYCRETALASVPAEGWAAEWNQSWNNDDGEMQVLWSPSERSDGYIPSGVSQASITFTALNDDQTRYCAGTIYIIRDDNITDSWDDWYRVTVVGQGLTVTNDDFGALISWDGN